MPDSPPRAGSVPLYQFRHLASLSWLRHGVSGRKGGVSQGSYGSLNVSYTVGDDDACVDENLRCVAHALGAERDEIFTAYQVHGADVALVDASTLPSPHCDVLLASTPDRVLMLRFADCVPVLLADPRQQVVAIAHAGWRGSAAQVARVAVQAMGQAFGTRPEDLLAGIGPSIGPCCYEVGGDLVSAFGSRAPELFSKRAGATYLDLWQANVGDLIEAGVPADQVEVARICTRCQPDAYFSHRAHGGRPAGRFGALIGLAA